MLQRKFLEILRQWKAEGARKALCITGARQIGKTTLVREFGRANYKDFAELNFITSPEAAAIFQGSLDAGTLTSGLTAHLRRKLTPGKTLVFLDEIQACPRARTAIKFLVEDGRFDYIESGSLLGVGLNSVPSYPVGFERILRMYPMDLEEFFLASGIQEETLALVRQCFQERRPLPEAVHLSLKELFQRYVVVGGMPQVVQRYLDTQDMGEVVENQRDILTQYRMDVGQYSTGADRVRIQEIFDRIPSQLNDRNRRFIVTSMDPNARLSRYENGFRWLEEAGVGLACCNVTTPQAPLSLNSKKSLFKLFMGDTGLLCAACLDGLQLALLQGRMDINMGAILENAIAQELAAHGHRLHYFDSVKQGEVDFVVQNGADVDLVEVKSGADYRRHRAMDNMMAVDAWKFGNAFVLCRDNLSVEGGVTYLPWYMAMCL